MKPVTLATAALAAIVLSTGFAAAQMQPIPNPPEHHGMDYGHDYRGHHHGRHHHHMHVMVHHHRHHHDHH